MIAVKKQCLGQVNTEHLPDGRYLANGKYTFRGIIKDGIFIKIWDLKKVENDNDNRKNI